MGKVPGASEVDSLGWCPTCLSSSAQGDIFKGNLQILWEHETMDDKKEKREGWLIANAVWFASTRSHRNPFTGTVPDAVGNLKKVL